MKSDFKSNENMIFEFAKRSFYSFQVLIIGIAIPFLFLFGISNINQNQKKTQDKEDQEITNTAKPVKTVIGFYIPRV